MHHAIEERTEGARGCGYRTKKGYYLIAAAEGMPCGKLPYPLDVCRTCGQGIKPARGWTWISPREMFTPDDCGNGPMCAVCPMCETSRPDRAGLIWVGEKFYPTPEAFQEESRQVGVCRKINQIPHGFVLGETWVFLAHRKGIELWDSPEEDSPDLQLVPAIFSAFKPTAIETVVDGTEPDEEIEALVKRGITPVKIERDVEQLPLSESYGSTSYA